MSRSLRAGFLRKGKMNRIVILFKSKGECAVAKNKAFRFLAIWLSAAMLIGLPVSSGFQTLAAENSDSAAAEAGSPETEQVNEDNNGYGDYLNLYSDKQKVYDRADAALVSNEKAVELDGCEAAQAKEGESISYTIHITKSGLYNLGLIYYPVSGKGLSIEFSMDIDGKLPFSEAQYISLYRVWKDETAPGEKTDSSGNDIAPQQTEVPQYVSTYVQDNSGIYNEAYEFYMEAGEHTICLTSQRETLAVKEVWMQSESELKSYAELQKEYEAAGYKPADAKLQVIEAEQTELKSDSVLYGRNDRSSPDTTPYSASKIKDNIIGGSSWAAQGQWIEWTVNAEKSGLYKLALRARQNLLSGSFVTRKLYIDGKIPAAEFADIKINYSMNWQNVDIPYAVYLEAGTHTIRMEVTIGDLSGVVEKINDAVYQLNSAYRRIVMITGTSPDSYRDYQLETSIPEVFDTFNEEIETLKQCDQWLLKMTGKRGSMNGILQTLSNELELFTQKPEKIQKSLSTFKDNIGSLGTWLVNIKQQSLELDKIYLYSADASADKLPEAESGFFGKLSHEAQTFFYSFIVDYNSIGNSTTDNSADSIEVWCQGGRDQANIIRQLVNNEFTPGSKINVNLKLVQGQLMAATASGRGPDVVLQLGNSEPVNYALRSAAVDLTRFSDFHEVSSRFRPSALVPYQYNGGVYALPETQTFQIMFYRTDVLNQLGLSVPKTWDDMLRVAGIMQRNNMTIGIQPPNSAAGSFTALSSMAMFLYQRGGELYTDNNSKSGLSSEAAQEAFEFWVSLYTDYKLPTKYDAQNRFRSGEMPIVIEDFTFYNLLSVAAPEIRGMWSFSEVPGTERDDGTVDHSVSSTGICCMMMKASKHQDAAWRFMSWWTGADTQNTYGQEIESQLGVSARYPSANVEAFSQMAWSVKEMNTLNSQWVNVKAIPEVPGGYFTSRHLNNAFRRVLSYNDNPRETLLDYSNKIDSEITAKRKEFSLDSK